MPTQDSNPTKLNLQAQALWEQGRKDDAIRHLVTVINQTPKKLPRNCCLQLAFYLFQGKQFRSAETVLTEYLRQNPEDYEALENRGIMRSRMGNNPAAYTDFKTVVTYRPESANAWDALTAASARLGKYEEAQTSGAKVLALKDQSCLPQNLVSIQLPNISPTQWDKEHQHKKDIISFSLWGNNPIYLRGAIRNLLETPKLYPGWICRFYVDQSVPKDFGVLVKELGGEVITEHPGQTQRQKLGWRFQVANDANTRRFLVRDADSVISRREVNAVEDWIQSDRWFHVMRDWWTHTDLVLAGMWGGRAGLLETLMPKLLAYQSGKLETANIDQWFLRDCVWGAIRSHCLIHDRYYRALDAKQWPDSIPEGNFHVGQNESAVRAEYQTEMLKPLIQKYDWLRLPDQ